MTYTATFLFGLILMSQVEVLYSADTGFCYFCKDYLNAVQCTQSLTASCIFKNGLCTTLPANTTVVANPTCSSQNSTVCSGMDGNSNTNQCIVYNGSNVCSSFYGANACNTYTNYQQCQMLSNCIWQPTNNNNQSIGNCIINTCSNQNVNFCSGNDGVNSTLACYVPTGSNVCASFDPTLACSSFQQQQQCSSVLNCYYTKSTGSCSNAACSQRMTQGSCKAIFYSSSVLSLRPCKWTQNDANTGSCATGLASDLSQQNCALLSFWFTYNDQAQVCTACTEAVTSSGTISSLSNSMSSSSSSYIVWRVIFSILVIALGW